MQTKLLLEDKVVENISFDNGVTQNYSTTKIQGIGIVVYVDGSMSCSFASTLNMDSALNVIDKAVYIAKVLESVAKSGVYREI